MIYVIATIEVAAGQREMFLSEFRQLVPLVLAEEGCLDYGPAIDLETNLTPPPAVRENVVTILEKWESIEALERHLIAPHVVQYRVKVKGLVVGTSLRILRPA
ncbi:MAG: putative quinol monooxygenase [Planctomycetota bacterium]|nr:putative quinol monooxygenase [Planctomycetota bacterium]